MPRFLTAANTPDLPRPVSRPSRYPRRSALAPVIYARLPKGHDDFVVAFQHRHEAARFLAELRERLARFGLELHAGKTRLIEFGRFAAPRRKGRGDGKPEPFDFLGLTHNCGKPPGSNVYRDTVDDAQEVAGKVEGGESRSSSSPARSHPAAWCIPARARQRAHAILRSADE